MIEDASSPLMRRVKVELRSLSKRVNQTFEPEQIALGAEARDLPDARRCDLRLAPIRLTCLGVREMDLDAGQGHRFQSIEQRERRVRQRGTIEEQPVERGARLCDPIEEHALMIGLPAVYIYSELLAARDDLLVNEAECLVTVDLRLSHAEQLQVGTRQAQDAERLLLVLVGGLGEAWKAALSGH
jgi:hypothetical protein